MTAMAAAAAATDDIHKKHITKHRARRSVAGLNHRTAWWASWAAKQRPASELCVCTQPSRGDALLSTKTKKENTRAIKYKLIAHLQPHSKATRDHMNSAAKQS